MRTITTPISEEIAQSLSLGDRVNVSGYIYTGRDAVLPRVASLIRSNGLEEAGIDLRGSVIFHTAVSPAGVGPTSSNKLEIEGNFDILSEGGVKMHLGKGAISRETIEMLSRRNAVYAVIPPVTALLQSKILEQKVVAFPEEGMEALHLLKVHEFPVIIAAAHGKSIY